MFKRELINQISIKLNNLNVSEFPAFKHDFTHPINLIWILSNYPDTDESELHRQAEIIEIKRKFVALELDFRFQIDSEVSIDKEDFEYYSKNGIIELFRYLKKSFESENVSTLQNVILKLVRQSIFLIESNLELLGNFFSIEEEFVNISDSLIQDLVNSESKFELSKTILRNLQYDEQVQRISPIKSKEIFNIAFEYLASEVYSDLLVKHGEKIAKEYIQSYPGLIKAILEFAEEEHVAFGVLLFDFLNRENYDVESFDFLINLLNKITNHHIQNYKYDYPIIINLSNIILKCTKNLEYHSKNPQSKSIMLNAIYNARVAAHIELWEREMALLDLQMLWNSNLNINTEPEVLLNKFIDLYKYFQDSEGLLVYIYKILEDKNSLNLVEINAMSISHGFLQILKLELSHLVSQYEIYEIRSICKRNEILFENLIKYNSMLISKPEEVKNFDSEELINFKPIYNYFRSDININRVCSLIVNEFNVNQLDFFTYSLFFSCLKPNLYLLDSKEDYFITWLFLLKQKSMSSLETNDIKLLIKIVTGSHKINFNDEELNFNELIEDKSTWYRDILILIHTYVCDYNKIEITDISKIVNLKFANELISLYNSDLTDNNVEAFEAYNSETILLLFEIEMLLDSQELRSIIFQLIIQCQSVLNWQEKVPSFINKESNQIINLKLKAAVFESVFENQKKFDFSIYNLSYNLRRSSMPATNNIDFKLNTNNPVINSIVFHKVIDKSDKRCDYLLRVTYDAFLKKYYISKLSQFDSFTKEIEEIKKENEYLFFDEGYNYSVMCKNRTQLIKFGSRLFFDLPINPSLQDANQLTIDNHCAIYLHSHLYKLPISHFYCADEPFFKQFLPVTVINNFSNKIIEEPIISNIMIVGNCSYHSKYLNLPSSKTEIELIKEICDKHGLRSQVIENKNCTKSSVINSIKNKCPNILHFTTHGFYLDGFPHESNFILLSTTLNSEINLDEYILNFSDIINLKLNGVSLVFLSTCNNAKDDNAKGSSIRGLAFAFLKSGAKFVIGTRNPISDYFSTIFVKAFYETLFANNSNVIYSFNLTLKYVLEKYPNNVLEFGGWEIYC